MGKSHHRRKGKFCTSKKLGSDHRWRFFIENNQKPRTASQQMRPPINSKPNQNNLSRFFFLLLLLSGTVSTCALAINHCNASGKCGTNENETRDNSLARDQHKPVDPEQFCESLRNPALKASASNVPENTQIVPFPVEYTDESYQKQRAHALLAVKDQQPYRLTEHDISKINQYNKAKDQRITAIRDFLDKQLANYLIDNAQQISDDIAEKIHLLMFIFTHGGAYRVKNSNSCSEHAGHYVMSLLNTVMDKPVTYKILLTIVGKTVKYRDSAAFLLFEHVYVATVHRKIHLPTLKDTRELAQFIKKNQGKFCDNWWPYLQAPKDNPFFDEYQAYPLPITNIIEIDPQDFQTGLLKDITCLLQKELKRYHESAGDQNVRIKAQIRS
ncbi:MAG: hypothetical protein KIT27_05905 [Legionellales bacterium]|nr:hypothetical protein [Legionellales bacterium]